MFMALMVNPTSGFVITIDTGDGKYYKDSGFNTHYVDSVLKAMYDNKSVNEVKVYGPAYYTQGIVKQLKNAMMTDFDYVKITAVN